MLDGVSYKIAYQGASGAFSHLAAEKFASVFLANKKCTFVPSSSFDEVFAFANSEENAFACVPFENSTIGSIIGNYQLLWDSKLINYCELTLPIHHQLLALPGTRMEDVVEVYSHPVALDQCKRIFHEHSWMHPHIYFDTGASAKLIRDKGLKNAAAIASKQAAEEYKLEVIAPDVEDYPQNQTRFALLGRSGLTELNPGAEMKLPFKFTVALATAGELNQLMQLAPFVSVDCNLIKIESLPIPEHPFQFRLFLDFLVTGEKGRHRAKEIEFAIKGLRNFGRYKSVEQLVG